MRKVLYIIDSIPQYRDKFFQELGKEVELTVVTYRKSEEKTSNKIMNYHKIVISNVEILGLRLNFEEYFIVNRLKPDCLIIGYNLRNVFRMMNLLRIKTRVIPTGLIYGTNNNFFLQIARRFFLNNCEGVLVYSNLIKQRLKLEIKSPIMVFNNTAFFQSEIKELPPQTLKNELNVIWVGSYKPRKKIERLIDLAERDSRIKLKLIGPGIKSNIKIKEKANIEIIDAAYDLELEQYFQWSHVILNPGNAGLLVMNAARFFRPIVIDKNSYHGPEIQLAIDAEQFFIDFGNPSEVQEVINSFFKNPDQLDEMGSRMLKEMHNYTIEHMVAQYMKAINGNWDYKIK